MRILVTRKPTIAEVDGLDLRGFRVGQQYEVGTRVGSYMVAERWAEFIDATGRRLKRGPDRRGRADRRHAKRLRRATERRQAERRGADRRTR